jgi:alkanesulfonate monooxygenase SsuD/methylene tetrahydromethanopterin reductase-like flavin-dependent oxidoreductase (luciferase family)
MADHLIGTAMRAEAVGFNSIWMWDHLSSCDDGRTAAHPRSW